MDDDRLTAIVRTAAAELLTTPAMERLVKEIVLLTLLEIERKRDASAVRLFLRECSLRGVKARVDDKGQLLVTGADRLGPHLKAVLTLYRDQIFDELARDKRPRAALVNGVKAV